MRASALHILLAALAIASTTALLACGEEPLPRTTAAQIGGATVQRGAVDRWVVAAQGHGPRTKVFDPPRFRRCIAFARRGFRQRGATRSALPGPATLRRLCERSYRQFRLWVMRAVVGAKWIEGEARSHGISVSDTQVRRRIRRARGGARSMSLDGFRLAWAGLFPPGAKYWVGATLLAEALHAAVIRNVAPPTHADIARYYRLHRARYAIPERRDVLTHRDQEPT
jgi:hypothetical protein